VSELWGSWESCLLERKNLGQLPYLSVAGAEWLEPGLAVGEGRASELRTLVGVSVVRLDH